MSEIFYPSDFDYESEFPAEEWVKSGYNPEYCPETCHELGIEVYWRNY